MTMVEKQTSDAVAREADDVRADLAHTLQQLRENLKPEHVIEEVVGNARASASTLADGMYGLAKAHPLPALLIGAGCAMVMGLRSRSPLNRSSPLGSTPATRGPAPPKPAATAPHPASTNGATTMNELTARFPPAPRGSEPRLSGLLHEQPLILAALGVAVGAAIGAAFPGTRLEDEWMGQISASVKHAAQSVAQHEIDDLKAVAARAAAAR